MQIKHKSPIHNGVFPDGQQMDNILHSVDYTASGHTHVYVHVLYIQYTYISIQYTYFYCKKM
jgi:hypothetical protein